MPMPSALARGVQVCLSLAKEAHSLARCHPQPEEHQAVLQDQDTTGSLHCPALLELCGNILVWGGN